MGGATGPSGDRPSHSYISILPPFPPHLSPKIQKKREGEEKGSGEALPDIRPLCAHKYFEVCELPAALKHQSSWYTQYLEVGLAGRITTVLGKEKGKKGRPHNMGGTSWT